MGQSENQCYELCVIKIWCVYQPHCIAYFYKAADKAKLKGYLTE